MMLTKIKNLIEKLNQSNIRYCHWKSNMALPQALLGGTDIDLLIRRKDADIFRTLLGQLGFRPATIKDGISFPSVEHYFALDEETGVLIHVHSYYRVITGESLSKNFRLPLEEMLLRNTREVDSVRVPTKGAELVIFTIRMMLKHTSLVELLLLARDWKQVKREIIWLLENNSENEAVKLAVEWLPSMDSAFYTECLDALRSPAPFFKRVILARRLRRLLSIYSRHSSIWSIWDGMQKFSMMAFRRLTRSERGMTLQSGGAVIAFVGPEATGKSTLIAEIKQWLEEHFAVGQIHAGKPGSTMLTMIPNLLVPALRYLLPTFRASRIETQNATEENEDKPNKTYPLITALRSVLLAYDRRTLLSRAFARAANGSIILCDRYPSLSQGSADGPQLSQFPIAREQYPVRYRLSNLEMNLYREIPPPDLVILLSVPLEVAITRNKNRGKEEPEDYVRLRHARSSNLEFERTSVYKVNTDQPLDRTVLEIKRIIWNSL
jgi:thymidylate kinase